MTNIVELKFRSSQRSAAPQRERSAEIVIFPGVRYERLDTQSAAPAKQGTVTKPLLRQG
ncbi:hypothetical protein [Tianweitania sediminis]|jgi:hypothetical protein|uniref:Uncharacterized protein n=1 Tax=Tianweitania sediminis TaxID=1502156 RepID=A0A8J7R0K8_9HYPH|nr:hypothetical protein [Tianweitania sediminis]MBP0438887.1 hypothetical protein [Tianweitania sediminis]HEV7416722.1 hypothetical protein [Tianweitania sediminis]